MAPLSCLQVQRLLLERSAGAMPRDVVLRRFALVRSFACLFVCQRCLNLQLLRRFRSCCRHAGGDLDSELRKSKRYCPSASEDPSPTLHYASTDAVSLGMRCNASPGVGRRHDCLWFLLIVPGRRSGRS